MDLSKWRPPLSYISTVNVLLSISQIEQPLKLVCESSTEYLNLANIYNLLVGYSMLTACLLRKYYIQCRNMIGSVYYSL